MEVSVLGRLDEVVNTYGHLRRLEEHQNQGDPIGNAEKIDAAQKALMASGSMLQKQLQASLLALEQPIRKPYQTISVYIPEAPGVLPEVVRSKWPSWWPRRLRGKYKWERP